MFKVILSALFYITVFFQIQPIPVGGTDEPSRFAKVLRTDEDGEFQPGNVSCNHGGGMWGLTVFLISGGEVPG